MTTRKKTAPRKATAKSKKSAARSKAAPKLPAGVTNLKIKPAQLRDHEMRPAHIAEVETFRDPLQDIGPVSEPLKRAAPRKSRAPKHLDVPGFANGLHAALKDKVVGYVMRLKKNGLTVSTRHSNWAQTPTDDSLPWTADISMNLASVSKLITAIAMTKLLNDNSSLTEDSKIIDHLPTYWKKGPGIKDITFKNLMTHTSGFFTASGQTDYPMMKAMVSVGVANRLGMSRYENMNFGLCRILIPIINGNINKNAILPDNTWDLLTITGYIMYVQSKVFGPAGVDGATLHNPAGNALAYSFPLKGAGWDSGNLMTVSGGAGWHMSVNDLLRVMGTFRRKGSIMSAADATKLLNNRWGIDQITDTDAGRLYNKRGAWFDDTGISGRVEQSVAYFLPEDMELAVLVNSPIFYQGNDIRTVVTDVYLANLK